MMPVTEVQARLDALAIKYSPDEARFRDLMKCMGNDLLKWIVCIERGQAGAGDARVELTNTLKAASTYVSQTLEKAGYSPSLSQILEAAKEPNFFKAVNSLDNDPAHVASHQLLKGRIARGAPAAESVKEREAPQKRQDPDMLPRGIGQPTAAVPEKRAASAAPTPAPEQRSTSFASAPAPRGRDNKAPGIDDASTRQGGGKEPMFKSEHVYSSHSALCFSRGESKEGQPSLFLEAALSTGPRAYDWPNKISVQLSFAEIMQIYAVLIGRTKKMEARGHGAGNDKSFAIEDQRSHFFVNVSQSGMQSRAVRIVPADGLRIAVFLAQFVMDTRAVVKSLADLDTLASRFLSVESQQRVAA